MVFARYGEVARVARRGEGVGAGAGRHGGAPRVPARGCRRVLAVSGESCTYSRGLGAGRAAVDLARAHYELRAFVSGEGQKERGGWRSRRAASNPRPPYKSSLRT